MRPAPRRFSRCWPLWPPIAANPSSTSAAADRRPWPGSVRSASPTPPANPSPRSRSAGLRPSSSCRRAGFDRLKDSKTSTATTRSHPASHRSVSVGCGSTAQLASVGRFASCACRCSADPSRSAGLVSATASPPSVPGICGLCSPTTPTVAVWRPGPPSVAEPWTVMSRRRSSTACRSCGTGSTRWSRPRVFHRCVASRPGCTRRRPCGPGPPIRGRPGLRWRRCTWDRTGRARRRTLDPDRPPKHTGARPDRRWPRRATKRSGVRKVDQELSSPLSKVHRPPCWKPSRPAHPAERQAITVSGATAVKGPYSSMS